MKFYKHNPDAFLAGTGELSLEQCGAYIRLINLLYSRDDVLPDNDAAIARIIGCQVRRWQRLKADLIELGKIRIDNDGLLHANGVTNTCLEAQEFSFRQRSRVSKRWSDYKKAKEFNDSLIRPRNTTITNYLLNTEISTESEKAKPPLVDNGDNEFDRIFNATPKRSQQIPVSGELTAKIKAGWGR
jgi:uncharacterized protein YdaU (DUF1376 family)